MMFRGGGDFFLFQNEIFTSQVILELVHDLLGGKTLNFLLLTLASFPKKMCDNKSKVQNNRKKKIFPEKQIQCDILSRAKEYLKLSVVTILFWLSIINFIRTTQKS